MCVAEKNVEVSDTTSEVKVRCCVRVRDIFAMNYMVSSVLTLAVKVNR